MAERDQIDVDVLIVGGGPAGLAAAIKLRQLAAERGKDDLAVMLIEKGGDVGAHGLSGAVIDPKGLDELLPDWRDTAPLEAPVGKDELWFLTQSRKIAFPAPFVPPMMKNAGKYVASLQRLTKWLGEIAEQNGADVFAAFPGQELLWEGQRVVGVRVGDKGVDHNGNPKANYEPGPDLFAKVVILAEGVRGTLVKQAVGKLGLDEGRDPQVYAAGIKELWQCAPGKVQPGSVIHTLGFPLPSDTFGGGFIYGMRDDVLDIGMVTGLDYQDPTTDPHDNLQLYKQHPAVAAMLEGGKLIRYGAKAIPEGGLYAMPRPYADGLLLIGDSGGFLNGMRLKGIHLAIKSGIMAAETAFDAVVAGNSDAAQLASFERAFRDSWAYGELKMARNFHQAFAKGMYAGVFSAGVSMYTGGRAFGIVDRLKNHPGYAQMKKLAERAPRAIEHRAKIDNVLTFDKLTDVFNSGTMHDEDQVPHLHVADTRICAERCTVEYGNPCQYFCPAKVYEPLFAKSTENGGTYDGRLQINFSNCVHCKTCDIMDPYQIITWVPPQGGEGPVYTGM
ncbi:MAG: electron transfer flavoprotein-ubiquinone oxidoreductase [Candidatus Eremiobacteraeota bacterium]|nr:electron transfer flavoprotein-ubiquinone oxidoreductase [Candidatus Eremiobacteraeota bacterium]